ncbi:hypothetical protein HPB50_023284 [Hyalomma asiaticum]|uniref:Uncharacterized protein n=1 Tax=Hyalomma asiaticum TaxID=266040 RepID=A0ACB7SC67_HYAAI|nr:hypothetical protein HPB50_023284 [Hyalomma asiaticum]
MRQLLFAAALTALLLASTAKKSKEGAKPDWAKKDVRDFNDADLERLYEQWEEDEEPLEPDELPEYMRPAPKIDMSKLDASNPENILKASKKGRMLMTFITLLGKPTREETEEITSIWQTSLMNNHISVDRIKLETITIENKPYYGKNAGDKISARAWPAPVDKCQEESQLSNTTPQTTPGSSMKDVPKRTKEDALNAK